MNNKTEHFLALMFLVALAYVCINCGMSFIDLRSKPQQDNAQQVASTNVLKSIVIPKMSFSSSSTLADAISFFYETSKQYNIDKGINFILNTNGVEAIPALPKIQAQSISLHDALKLCCDQTGFTFEMKDNIVRVHKK